MKKEELLLSAMDGVKEEYLMEANEYRRGKCLVRRRGILIAAAAAAVLAITAGAVTLSMRDAAKADLGIDDPEKIEEYTEYEPGEVAQTEAGPVAGYIPGGPAELVSTLCSGDDLVAYLSVPDCGAVEKQALGIWDIGEVDVYEAGATEPLRAGISILIDETNYDPEAGATLVRLRVMDLPETADHICARVIRRVENEVRGIAYDMAEIPVTESAGLRAEINRTVPHPDLPEFQAQIEVLEIYADYVSVKVKTPSYDETLALLGEDAWGKLEMTVYGERIENALDATYAYHGLLSMMMNPYEQMTADPDSPKSPHYIMEGAALNLKDGTQLVLADQERELAGLWSFADSNLDDPTKTGQWAFNCVLTNALDLTEIESISFGGETYPLTAE